MLKTNLSALLEPDEITMVDGFHHVLGELNQAIHATIDAHVPWSNPCPYSKRWWSKELSQAKRATQALSQKSYRQRGTLNHPVHEAFHQA
jgi:hypothetical protein